MRNQILSWIVFPFLLIGFAASNYITLEPAKESASMGRIYSYLAIYPDYKDPHAEHRAFSPKLARYLGVRTDTQWLYFLFASFCFGLYNLYAFFNRKGGPTWLSFLIASTATASTIAWYSVYVPGYPDWFLFLILGLALFSVEKWPLFFIFSALALLTHERSVFVLLGIPLGVFLIEGFPRKKLNATYLALFSAIAGYVAWRYLYMPDVKLNLDFYKNEAINGSVYAKEPLSPGLIWNCLWNSYKFLLIPFLASIALLFYRRSKKSFIEGGFICLFFAVVSLQFFFAVDTVRLMDFLIYPIMFALIFALRRRDQFFHVILAALVLALVANQLTPVDYDSQNWRFRAKSTTRFDLGAFLPGAKENVEKQP